MAEKTALTVMIEAHKEFWEHASGAGADTIDLYRLGAMVAALQALDKAGWALVPKEPTEAMYQATRGKCDAHGFNHETKKHCLTYETVHDLYRAMLSAGRDE